MTRSRACWGAAAALAVLVSAARAEARDPDPVLEIGYSSLLMAGHDLDFEKVMHGGDLGMMVIFPASHPVYMRTTLGMQGTGWTDPATSQKGHRLLASLTLSAGLGIGKLRIVMPYVEVGLGPKFVFMRYSVKSKSKKWGWSIGLQGQVGLLFRIKKMLGLKVGVGVQSISLYHDAENLGGVWFSAAMVFGLPGRGYEPPPPPYEPPPPPPDEPQAPPSGQGFEIGVWVDYEGGNSSRPVVYAKVNRNAGFVDEVSVWLVMPDGSEWLMQKAGAEDPDLWQLSVYMLGLHCGYQYIGVGAKSGFTERSNGIGVNTPCPNIPGGV